eukprot:Rmarinus@m.19022
MYSNVLMMLTRLFESLCFLPVRTESDVVGSVFSLKVRFFKEPLHLYARCVHSLARSSSIQSDIIVISGSHMWSPVLPALQVRIAAIQSCFLYAHITYITKTTFFLV